MHIRQSITVLCPGCNEDVQESKIYSKIIDIKNMDESTHRQVCGWTQGDTLHDRQADSDLFALSVSPSRRLRRRTRGTVVTYSVRNVSVSAWTDAGEDTDLYQL